MQRGIEGQAVSYVSITVAQLRFSKYIVRLYLARVLSTSALRFPTIHLDTLNRARELRSNIAHFMYCKAS